MSRWPGRLITKTPVTPGGSSPTASAPGVWTLPEMAYWKKQGLWPDASADAYWGYVSYLMATSSLSNANNNLFVDSSGAFSPVSRNGNTTQGSVTPYGTLWSVYLDGSGDYLQTTAVNISSGNFTVEAWVYLNTMPTTDSWPGSFANWMVIAGVGSASASDGWQFRIGQTVLAFGTNGDTTAVSATHSMVVGQWYHLAVTRSGNVYTLYRNGTSIGSATYTANAPGTGAFTWIGTETNQGAYLNGYASNVRVVAGTAVYTANFTPPAAPLSATSDTVLLTCQSNRFRDASTNNFAITRGGDARVMPFSPFVLSSPGAVYNQSDISYWSGYFDGSGDYLSAPTNAAYDVSGGDYTIEAWVNLSALPAANNSGNRVAGVGIYSSGFGGGWEVGLDLTQNLVSIGQPGSSSANSASYTFAIGQWYHVAICRASGTNRIFVNGTSLTLTTNTFPNNATGSAQLRIGAGLFSAGYEHYLPGYISGFRIVKGTGLYSSNFTPPTAPLTAVSGTSMLTCQSAAFTDNSANNAVITANGNTTVTGNNPYQSGYYSNYFDGTGDGLSISSYSSSALAFGTSDFTIEFWAFATTGPNNNWTPFFTMGNSGGGQEIRISQNINGTGFGWIYPNNTNNGDVYAGYGAMTTNTWHHIAMTRSGSTMRLFLDGAVIATGTGVSFNFTNTTILRIGLPQPAYADGAFTGYLSNLRIVKGTAVYTGAFTPPTAPLTAISGTGLLTCQANRLIDSSANAFALTKVGDTSVSPFDPFYTATIASNGGSMYFDGSGDYLTLPSSDLYRVDTGDWTMEAWLYPTSTGVQHTVMNRGVYLSTYSFYFGTNGTSVYYEAGTGGWAATPYTSSSGAIIAGQWNHIAVVRSGTSLLMYANGNRVLNQASASFGANVTAPLQIGAYLGGTAVVNGNLTDVRFTKGTALYTGATYTVPTAPLTPSGNTTLLLNGMNAGEYDAAMQNNFETIGNAQASSVQAKYGPTSAYFSGAVDNYITAPNSPAFQFGTGSLTIEAWIYLTGDTITNPDGNRSATICSGIGATGVSNDFWFNVTGNTTTTGTGLNFQVFNSGSGTVIFNTAYSFSKSVWYHVAFTRSGNNVYLFVDGTVIASTTYSGTITAGTNPLRVGYGQSGSVNYRQPFPGYIDDLRITKGYARYTANFTPPTAALPIY